MIKDKRYKTIKNLIESRHITLFREIFDTLPKSIVYKDLGMNNERFTNLMNNVELFLLNDLFRIADLIETEKGKLLEVVYNQYLADNQNIKKVRKNIKAK
jgi:hypothetical protein